MTGQLTRNQQRIRDFNDKRPALEAEVRKLCEDVSECYFEIDDKHLKVYLLPYGRFRSKDNVTIKFNPLKGTWQIKDRVFHGGVEAFQIWLTRRLRNILWPQPFKPFL